MPLPLRWPLRGRGTGLRVTRGQAVARPPRGRDQSRRVAAAQPRASPPRGPMHRRHRMAAEAVHAVPAISAELQAPLPSRG